VGSLCGYCKWCLLLLAGWCEGFYGVRISEALAAYVILFIEFRHPVTFRALVCHKQGRRHFLVGTQAAKKYFSLRGKGNRRPDSQVKEELTFCIVIHKDAPTQ
jgi:hypothetical protein